MKSIILTVLVLLSTQSFLYTQSTHEIEIIDNVKTIRNFAPLWGDDPKIQLEFVRQIGEYDGKGDIYLFNPQEIKRDTEGNLFILDAGNYRILKIDSTDGRVLEKYGRRGQGPGEFDIEPTFLNIDNSDNLYISPLLFMGNNIIMNRQGDEIKRFRFKSNSVTNKVIYGMRDLKLSPSGNFLIVFGYFTKGYKGSENELPGNGVFGPEFFASNVFRYFNRNGTFVSEFAIEVMQTHVENNFVRGHINDVIFAFDADSNVYIAFLYQNRIEKYAPDGTLLMSISRDKPYKTTLDFEKSDRRPNLSIFSNSIDVDNRNRIWISSVSRRLTEDENKNSQQDIENIHIIEIFDHSGRLLCSIPIGYFNKHLQVRVLDDRLFIIDRYSRMCIYEYRIVDLE